MPKPVCQKRSLSLVTETVEFWPILGAEKVWFER